MVSVSLFSMLQAASGGSRQAPAVKRDRTKQIATMAKKRLAKWRGIFAEYGGRAGTNTLAGHLGRVNPSILSTMYDLEQQGLVRRAGYVLKSGPGKSQIIWEWIENAD